MISLGILPTAIFSLPLRVTLSTCGRLRILSLRIPALMLPGLDPAWLGAIPLPTPTWAANGKLHCATSARNLNPIHRDPTTPGRRLCSSPKINLRERTTSSTPEPTSRGRVLNNSRPLPIFAWAQYDKKPGAVCLPWVPLLRLSINGVWDRHSGQKWNFSKRPAHFAPSFAAGCVA